MRIAALYDIHGNLPALEAVLDELARENVDEIVVGGDVVPGPMPAESLALLADLPLPVCFITGNGEIDVVAASRGESGSLKHLPEPVRSVVHWCAGQLSEAALDRLSSWAATGSIAVPEMGDVLFCHASPRNCTDIFTMRTPESSLSPLLSDVDATVVVCGHTHMQFDRSVGGIRLVNAGSFGMPFGEPGGYWLLIDYGIQLRRTDYDLAKAAERIGKTAYPQAQGFADKYVMDPPSEEEMLAAFEPAALG